jgi:hypothetical protein
MIWRNPSKGNRILGEPNSRVTSINFGIGTTRAMGIKLDIRKISTGVLRYAASV